MKTRAIRKGFKRLTERSEKMTLIFGGTKEKSHFESGGKLYGFSPFGHCDTDCSYKDGACIGHCSHLKITPRPCLKRDYRRMGRAEQFL
jgi:hypothetical protein